MKKEYVKNDEKVKRRKIDLDEESEKSGLSSNLDTSVAKEKTPVLKGKPLPLD